MPRERERVEIKGNIKCRVIEIMMERNTREWEKKTEQRAVCWGSHCEQALNHEVQACCVVCESLDTVFTLSSSFLTFKNKQEIMKRDIKKKYETINHN